MNFIVTSRFERAYHSLPAQTQERVKDVLRMLAKDMRHPSLHAKKIQGAQGIWEARVSLECRLTFQIEKHSIILRNVGHHDLTLKRP